MKINIQRIYDEDPGQHKNSYRVLVDRIWPRGITKQDAALDEWSKDLAPSDSLRKWFGHEVDKWPDFRKRYLHELSQIKETVRALLDRAAAKDDLLLLYGAKDETHNNARVLKEYMEKLR